jgi:hypothetical protein
MKFYRVLDPVRLLEQIGTMQDALWRHAVLRNGEINSGHRKLKLVPEVRFEVTTGSPSARNNNTDSKSSDIEERRTRKYHRIRELWKPT